MLNFFKKKTQMQESDAPTVTLETTYTGKYSVPEEIERLCDAAYGPGDTHLKIPKNAFMRITGLDIDDADKHPAIASYWGDGARDLDTGKLKHMLGKEQPLSEASALFLAARQSFDKVYVPFADFEKITGISPENAKNHSAFLGLYGRDIWKKPNDQVVLSTEKLKEGLLIDRSLPEEPVPLNPDRRFTKEQAQALLAAAKPYNCYDDLHRDGNIEVTLADYQKIMGTEEKSVGRYDAFRTVSRPIHWDQDEAKRAHQVSYYFNKAEIMLDAGIEKEEAVQKEEIKESEISAPGLEKAEPVQKPTPVVTTVALKNEQAQHKEKRAPKEKKSREKKRNTLEVARENHLRNVEAGKIGDGSSSMPGREQVGR